MLVLGKGPLKVYSVLGGTSYKRTFLSKRAKNYMHDIEKYIVFFIVSICFLAHFEHFYTNTFFLSEVSFLCYRAKKGQKY